MSFPDSDLAALVAQVTKECIDEGLLIEAGWQSMRTMVLSPAAPEIQVSEMRKAFFAGAHHLFVSILATLEDDGTGEPPPGDFDRIEMINKELNEFAEELRREVRERP